MVSPGAEFTVSDFLTQIQWHERWCAARNLVCRIPVIGRWFHPWELPPDQREAKAIIQSMTLRERELTLEFGASRLTRNARGTGMTVEQVADWIGSFHRMRDLMKELRAVKGRKARDELLRESVTKLWKGDSP